MPNKAFQMNQEIRAIAAYRALVISKYYIAILLAMLSLYLGYLKINMSSLYIIIVLLAFPPLITSGMRDYSKKTSNVIMKLIQEEPFHLGELRKKYHYSRLDYLANSVVYLVTLLLIMMWQFRNHIDPTLPDYLRNMPFIILALGLFFRLICLLFYRIKLPYDLTHNKL